MTKAERNRRSSLPVSRNLVPVVKPDKRHLTCQTIGASSRTVRHHKPRNSWAPSRPEMATSPFYFNTTTIDRRWDK